MPKPSPDRHPSLRLWPRLVRLAERLCEAALAPGDLPERIEVDAATRTLRVVASTGARITLDREPGRN